MSISLVLEMAVSEAASEAYGSVRLSKEEVGQGLGQEGMGNQ